MNIPNIIKKIEKHPRAFPWSSEPETALFLQGLARMINAQSILEIGTYLGYTTLHLASTLLKQGYIYTVDNFDYFSQFYKLLPFTIRNKIHFIVAESQAALMRLDAHKKFDLIYVDGAHTFEHCYRDTVLCMRHVHHNTFICFHDALSLDYPGIRRVLRVIQCTNMFFLGLLYDILYVDTPVHTDGKLSGLGLVRIKYRSPLVQTILILLYQGILLFMDVYSYIYSEIN
jgi:predicted O-methyltransferase YrrM